MDRRLAAAARPPPAAPPGGGGGGWVGAGAVPVDLAARAEKHLEHLEGGEPSAPAPDGAPNVVLVFGCTVRKDQTSIYDASLDSTPFLAELASRGVRFDDLITAAPWTKAASTAVLTSRHALSIGMVEPGPRRNERVLPDAVPTLAERFRDAGYRTVGATANPNLHSHYGFDRGFQHYLQPRADWHGGGGGKLSGRVLTDAVFEQVDRTPAGRPLYLQVMYVDAHAPFSGGTPVDGLPEGVAHYRATLGRLDRAIEELFDGLEARGLLEDTVVMVINDHGEGLGYPEHHGKSHGRYLSPSSVGGVAVVVGPGIPAGGQVRGLASQVDLGPTLWGLAGLPATEWGGVDLSPVVRGERERTGQTRVYADTWFRQASRAAFYEEGRACQLSVGERKLVDRNGIAFEPGCFDRMADPQHARPMDDEGALRELERWRDEELATGATFPVRESRATGGLDEQLKALGYTD